MRKAISFAAVVAVCIAAFGAAEIWFGDIGRAASHANVLTFADPPEDSSSAADITTVTAANDDAGQFTIRITLANRPQLLAQDRLMVSLDTDRDDRSGDSNGADYFFVLSKTATSTVADVCRWTGTATLDCSIPSTTFRASFNAATRQVAFTINRSELGNTTGIGIVVRTTDGNDASHFDRAPNTGSREYEFPFVISPVTTSTVIATATTTVTTVVTAQPEGLRVGAVVLSPKKATAGKSLTASVSTRTADASAAVRASSIACRAKIGKATARTASKRTALGSASCTWRLPKSAKGKRISAAMVVSGGGVSAARGFIATIR
jgi:hypothetical protein